jgi:hypothetical protein
MEILIDTTPAECLKQAAEYMVGEVGCTIDHSNEYSITFSHKPNVTGGGLSKTVLALDSALGREKGVGAGQLMQTQALLEFKTTLVALPADGGGARLSLGGIPATTEILHEWIKRDLLNLSAELLDKISSGKQMLTVYSDRVELTQESGTETIMLDQIEDISLEQGWVNATLGVRSRDGRVLSLEKLDGRKAKNIHALIEERVDSLK